MKVKNHLNFDVWKNEGFTFRSLWVIHKKLEKV